MLKLLNLIFCFTLCCLKCDAFPYYLQLDNQTAAVSGDLVEDPFLVIRTKQGSFQDRMDWGHSWQVWAEFDTQDSFFFRENEQAGIQEQPNEKQLTQALTVFDHQKPTFTFSYDKDSQPKMVRWQISRDADFKQIYPNLDNQIPYTAQIQLSDLEETFLNPEQIYYFRACTDGGEWTCPQPFMIYKPASIQNIHFTKQEEEYQLKWDALPGSSIQYYVFASHALDFVPSIYTLQQPNLLQEGQILDAECTANLIAVTTHPFLTLEGSYPFYRLIAYERGQFGIPSSLIYLYDQKLQPFRTCLTQDSHQFRRQPLAHSYQEASLLPYGAFLAMTIHPFVVPDVWEKLEPYFLPINHPIKRKLDRLFHKKRVTQSRDIFEQAGFGNAEMRKPTNIVVGKHPDFKGYLFKVFLDTQPPVCEWCHWLKRIEGAQAIQDCITTHGFQHFRVPKKWIYPLPAEPSPPYTSHYHRKNFILIVEDMQILSKEENLKAFKKNMRPKILRELYTILTEEGLIGSVYPKNIPFTHKGDLAFIDTEHHHIQPVPYHKLTRFLSAEMRDYWQTLTE